MKMLPCDSNMPQMLVPTAAMICSQRFPAMRRTISPILETLLADASQGKPARRKLQSGLIVEIQALSPSIKIILSRDSENSAPPSLTEWPTILRHFPYDIPPTQPSPTTHRGLPGITGTVPARTWQQHTLT
jgi:hypothetical protein